MVEVLIDAASKGNPGPSGGGIVIKGNGYFEEFSFPLGEMGNHEAEFFVFVKALEICLEKGFRSAYFRTDSKIVADSVEKQYVKNAEFKRYLEKASELIEEFDLFFIKWVPSSENKTADELARQGIRLNKDLR